MKVEVVESVLKANDALAAANRRRLIEAGLLTINMMSAPGSGKTTLLEQTFDRMGPEHPCAVMVGDLQTSRDAERLSQHAAKSLQINTGKGCHLTPTQTAEGLDRLDLSKYAYLFIENVGNMVCPAAFDLGEHVRVVLLSIPEGDDKIAKYPTLFQQADAVLLTKTDLLAVLDYNMQQVRDDLSVINTRAEVIELSSKTGAGFERWIRWLHEQRAKHTKSPQ